MKNVLSLLTCILLCAAQCNKEVSGDIPECIEGKINAIKEGKVWNPPAKIYRYQYRGQTVYYFPPRCCDIPSILYDKDCKAICSPDGGFTGKGSGGCTDFTEERMEEELLWEDKREYPD